MSAQDDAGAAARSQTKSAKPATKPSTARADLIRSIVRCRPTDPVERVTENVQAVRDANLEFELVEDGQIWAFVEQFVRDHGHAPEFQTVELALLASGLMGAADRMRSVVPHPLKWGGDYAADIEQIREDHHVKIIAQTMRDQRLILTTGLEVGTGRDKRVLRGAQQAAAYAWEIMGPIAAPPHPPGLAGPASGQSVRAKYARAKANPSSAFGQWTGIKQIDETLNGARQGELWVHAAFTGHLKTTFALNWAYNQSVWFHENVLYFSLEMPFCQVERWLIAMHSFHTKFREVRIQLGIQAPGSVDVGLDYKKLRDAQLSDAEQTFLDDHVTVDWDDPSNEYGTIHVEVADPTRPDITVEGLRARAETIYPKTPFSTVYVDHASLLGARSKYTNTTERLNEAMRDLKNQLAMNFRRGQGIPVVALFQINREGLKEAHKRKEKGQLPTYEITSLSYSNEAERSADVVTASYLDTDLAGRNRALFTCLKSRDNAPFAPCMAEVVWPCRRLLTCLDDPLVDHSTQADAAKIADVYDELTKITQAQRAAA